MTQTLTYAIDSRDLCSVFIRISYSRRDSVATTRQIVAHNAVHVSFCKEPERIVDRRQVCIVFDKISYSRLDTSLTVQQLVGHNAAWDSLCLA